MRWLRLLLVLLFAGCGEPPQRAIDLPVAPPPPGVQLGGARLFGPLKTLLVLTDFNANKVPYTEAQLAQVGVDLSAFINRNSTGLAQVDWQVVRISLPQDSYRVIRVQDRDGSSHFDPEPLLQEHAELAIAPFRTPGRQQFVLYFSPREPAIYSGYARGYAWLSASEEFPANLPVPHEYGHALTLPHADPGVMSGLDAASQRDWSGLYAPELRAYLGWPVDGP